MKSHPHTRILRGLTTGLLRGWLEGTDATDIAHPWNAEEMIAHGGMGDAKAPFIIAARRLAMRGFFSRRFLSLTCVGAKGLSHWRT